LCFPPRPLLINTGPFGQLPSSLKKIDRTPPHPLTPSQIVPCLSYSHLLLSSILTLSLPHPDVSDLKDRPKRIFFLPKRQPSFPKMTVSARLVSVAQSGSPPPPRTLFIGWYSIMLEPLVVRLPFFLFAVTLRPITLLITGTKT